MTISSRELIISLGSWLVLTLALAWPTTATPATPTATPTPALEYFVYLPCVAHNARASALHAVRISYPNVAQSRPLIPELQAHVAQVGANLVSLAAGRPDWAYFKWAGHEGWWSSDVSDTGLDFLAKDVANFSFAGHMDAVVDVYAPNYITGHPSAAAISYWGEPSPLQVSTASLVQGPFHDLLLDMIEYIAANYAVDSISLTELSYHIYGYGPDDLALYRAYSGQDDWPRYPDGSINPDDPSIGQWRSVAVSGFLAEAAERVHPYGVELWMDVSVSWRDLSNEGLEYGHHYPAMLDVADRLVVWAYTALNGYPPDYTAQIAAYLATHYDPARLILSVGLWDGAGGAISPDNLETALDSAMTGGVPHLWVTPSHLMTEEHWTTLARVWNP